MVGLMRGVFNGGQNILAFEIRVIVQNFFVRSARAQKLQNIGDPHPHATDARTSAAFAGFNRDALEECQVHGQTILLNILLNQPANKPCLRGSQQVRPNQEYAIEPPSRSLSIPVRQPARSNGT